ncbi:MAG TPA: hypothetical protein VGX97_05325 [bacterium]|nr:hypothetical protein [bacterium]
MSDPQQLQNQAAGKAQQGDHQGAAQDYEAAAQAHLTNGDEYPAAGAYEKAAQENTAAKKFDNAEDDYAKAGGLYKKNGDDAGAERAYESAAKAALKGAESDVAAAGAAKDAGDTAWKAAAAAEALSEGPPKDRAKDAEAAAKYREAAQKYGEVIAQLDAALAGIKLATVQAASALAAQKRIVTFLKRTNQDATQAEAKLGDIAALEAAAVLLKAVNEAALAAVKKLKKKAERKAQKEEAESHDDF